MPKITYHSLFELVNSQISKKLTYNTKTGYTGQGERVSVAPFSGDSISDRSSSKIVLDLVDILADSIPSHIKEGFLVTATNPVSGSVNVSAGVGAAAGFVYTLYEDIILPIPFDNGNSVFYVNIFRDAISIDSTQNSRKLTIAKIIVPRPGITSRVIDKRDNSWDAYIQNFTQYHLYGDGNGILEEDSIELLRDNIGAILADNIIGNIRLSEDLIISNTSGTVKLDSDSLKIFNEYGNTLAKFNYRGMFLYDEHGTELAKFTGNEARIGNIRITSNSIESQDFSTGISGFRIRDDGDAEFNDVTVRGIIYATEGLIGGWTIAANELYATTTGTIKTSANAGSGYNGVVIDKDGIRVYDDTLGLVVNLPSDGSAPTFSSGVINSTVININTNAIIRTSATVGDGSASSYGILINETGLYGCGPNQSISTANLKVLSSGDIYLRGEIFASSGNIGGITIFDDRLEGGTIKGATLIGAVIENSESLPRIRIDSTGLFYEIADTVGKYSDFLYGDGTLYGFGVLAKMFDANYPVLSILTETNLADIRLFNRLALPSTGTHELGDLIVKDGDLYICDTAGTPGTFTSFVKSSALISTHLYELLDVTFGGGDPVAGQTLQYSSGAWRPTSAVKTYRFPHTYAISGEVKIPSGDIDFIAPFWISLPAGQTATIKKASYIVNAGTSVTAKLQKNGADITGYTALSITTTIGNTTQDASLADGDKIALVITAVSGTPKNLAFTIFIEYSV